MNKLDELLSNAIDFSLKGKVFFLNRRYMSIQIKPFNVEYSLLTGYPDGNELRCFLVWHTTTIDSPENDGIKEIEFQGVLELIRLHWRRAEVRDGISYRMPPTIGTIYDLAKFIECGHDVVHLMG